MILTDGRTINGIMECEITGHMRFTAKSREDFPAVGDWVVLSAYSGDFVVIHQLLAADIFPTSAAGLLVLHYSI